MPFPVCWCAVACVHKSSGTQERPCCTHTRSHNHELAQHPTLSRSSVRRMLFGQRQHTHPAVQASPTQLHNQQARHGVLLGHSTPDWQYSACMLAPCRRVIYAKALRAPAYNCNPQSAPKPTPQGLCSPTSLCIACTPKPQENWLQMVATHRVHPTPHPKAQPTQHNTARQHNTPSLLMHATPRPQENRSPETCLTRLGRMSECQSRAPLQEPMAPQLTPQGQEADMEACLT